jgi:hypothetical protein
MNIQFRNAPMQIGVSTIVPQPRMWWFIAQAIVLVLETKSTHAPTSTVELVIGVVEVVVVMLAIVVN